MAANALSRCYEEGDSVALTIVVPDWYREVASSYETDKNIQDLLQQLVVDPNARQGYTLTNGLIKYQGRLVIRKDESLKRKILEALHSSPIGGHSGIVNTYHRVKQLFHWLGLKRYVMVVMFVKGANQKRWPLKGCYSPWMYQEDLGKVSQWISLRAYPSQKGEIALW